MLLPYLYNVMYICYVILCNCNICKCYTILKLVFLTGNSFWIIPITNEHELCFIAVTLVETCCISNLSSWYSKTSKVLTKTTTIYVLNYFVFTSTASLYLHLISCCCFEFVFNLLLPCPNVHFSSVLNFQAFHIIWLNKNAARTEI